MAETVKILFVDDEPAIRVSLPAILQMHGFNVTSAADVGQALHAISSQPFDVLISDLNIGSPGDGFTVVSAMRRTQPNCVTLILTGYPAFETALQAIRSQVDDYLIKPAGVQELVDSIETKLRNRTPHQLERLKRVPQILREHIAEIVDEIADLSRDAQQSAFVYPSEEECRLRADQLVHTLATQLMTGTSQLLPEVRERCRQHGQTSFQKGYSAAMLVEENRIVSSAVFDCVRNNLLVADVSQLLPDLKLLSDTLASMLREAVTTHDNVARAA